MGVKVSSKGADFKLMQKTVKDLNGKSVIVGCAGENAWLARIHEYGCRIRVTPKMRAYLHHKGLHLKASTTEIVIPERSFLRAGFDKHHIEVLKTAEGVLPDVLLGTMSVDQYAEMVGLILKGKIQDYAVSLKTPKNHPFTIEQKGSSNPLVDTGEMINSISYEVQDG